MHELYLRGALQVAVRLAKAETKPPMGTIPRAVNSLSWMSTRARLSLANLQLPRIELRVAIVVLILEGQPLR
jgi:hypothetical protein